MSIFNKKKIEEKPKIMTEAPEEFKKQKESIARDLTGLVFSKVRLDFQYGEIEHYSEEDLNELQDVSALYFDTKLKAMYKLNMRAVMPKDKGLILDIKNLEILKLDANNKIKSYEKIEKVHHYHPYQADKYGEIRQSWTKEEGYKTKSVEFTDGGEETSYIDDNINGIITNILKCAVEREIENNMLLKTKKNPNR